MKEMRMKIKGRPILPNTVTKNYRYVDLVWSIIAMIILVILCSLSNDGTKLVAAMVGYWQIWIYEINDKRVLTGFDPQVCVDILVSGLVTFLYSV